MIRGVRVVGLDHQAVHRYLSPLAALDESMVLSLGSAFSDVPWEPKHFLKELKGKWDLSQIAMDGEMVVGFWIASATIPGNCHTHRVGVSSQYRRYGVATTLFAALRESLAKKFPDVSCLTLEVGCNNASAQFFYKKLGFRALFREEIHAYLLARGREAEALEDCVREENGATFFVMKKEIQ